MSFRFVPTQRVTENSKKIAKNLKKLKNLVMASFQAKIGWKRLKKRENKNYRFDPFLPDGQQKIPKKNARKLKNLKKNHYGFISSQNRLEKAEKERK